MRTLAFAAALIALSACGHEHHATYSYAQDDGGCPSPARIPSGPQPNGAACDADADCVALCCTCPNKDGRGFEARACSDGKCDTTQACLLPTAAGLCP
jgi:hypothetical protein